MLLENRRVALVEDDPIMGESLVQRLSIEGATVQWWRDGCEAEVELKGFDPDIVVCDIRLPDVSGEELFRRTAKRGGIPPFLFITAYADIDQAVRLMRLGAGDYVTKPFSMDAFLSRLAGLMRRGNDGTKGELGTSPQMMEIESLLRRLADRSTTILLSGETGTGKEVCARFMHRVSQNTKQPFMAVNCAAIPAALMETQLFGHERGAYTGASGRHRGYAERAAAGILFLDEIGELPLALQAKLLRILEDREFTRVGGTDSIPFAARVVCATNASLQALVSQGRFREDLYYRINVIEVDIPPLRLRPTDVHWLMSKFLHSLAEPNASSVQLISEATMEMAVAHDWPGNARELRNRIERAMALATSHSIMPVDLFPEIEGTGQLEENLTSLAATRDLAEKRQIEQALVQAGGHVPTAAKLLGVSRSSMFAKVRRHGLGR